MRAVYQGGRLTVHWILNGRTAFLATTPLASLLAQLLFRPGPGSYWTWLGPALLGVLVTSAFLLLQGAVWAFGAALNGGIGAVSTSGAQIAPRLVVVIGACYLGHWLLGHVPQASALEPGIIGAFSSVLVLIAGRIQPGSPKS